MKKIITKISLLPLLTLFTKKKTVRKTSDIEIPMPPKNLKLKPIEPPISLKWEKTSEENNEDIKGYKVERSDRRPRYVPSRMNHDNLLCFSQNILSKIQASDNYTVPEPSLLEYCSLIADFEFALLETRQNKTKATVDYLIKTRDAVLNCLRYLKVKYNV